MPVPELSVQSEDLESFIEQYVATMIDRKVGEFLTRQLRGLVEARLAALKLSDPSFPSLDEHIGERLGPLVQKVLDERLPTQIKAEVKRTLRRINFD